MPVAYNQSGEYIISLLFPHSQEAILASIMEHQAHIFCFVTLTLLLFGVLNFPLCPHSSSRGNYTTHRTHAVFSHPGGNATTVILEVAKHRVETAIPGSESSCCCWLESKPSKLQPPQNQCFVCNSFSHSMPLLCDWDGAWWDAVEWWRLRRGARTWGEDWARMEMR